jgi:hypothetical protein
MNGSLPQAEIAFATNRFNAPVRLYHFIWTNPEPDRAIDNIRFVSAYTDATPFLVAISVEP